MKKSVTLLPLLMVCLITPNWAGGKNIIKAKVPPIRVDSWSGVYFGIQGSVVSSKGDVVVLDPSEFTIKPKGGSVGLFLGYNWSLPENTLLGIEADINALSVKKSLSNGLENHPGIYKLKEGYNGSIRARIGKIIQDKYLPYLTFGTVWTHLKVSSIPSKTKAKIAITPGFTAGSGLEFKVTDRVNARIEYRYNHYKKADFVHEGIGASNIKYKSHILQIGASYNF